MERWSVRCTWRNWKRYNGQHLAYVRRKDVLPRLRNDRATCLLRRLCRLGLRGFCFFSGCLWAPPSKCASGIAKPTDKIQDSTPWSGLPERGGAGIRARVLRSEGAHRKIFINVVVLSILPISKEDRRYGNNRTTNRSAVPRIDTETNG